jgi:hypothetical protein
MNPRTTIITCILALLLATGTAAAAAPIDSVRPAASLVSVSGGGHALGNAGAGSYRNWGYDGSSTANLVISKNRILVPDFVQSSERAIVQAAATLTAACTGARFFLCRISGNTVTIVRVSDAIVATSLGGAGRAVAGLSIPDDYATVAYYLGVYWTQTAGVNGALARTATNTGGGGAYWYGNTDPTEPAVDATLQIVTSGNGMYAETGSPLIEAWVSAVGWTHVASVTDDGTVTAIPHWLTAPQWLIFDDVATAVDEQTSIALYHIPSVTLDAANKGKWTLARTIQIDMTAGAQALRWIDPNNSDTVEYPLTNYMPGNRVTVMLHVEPNNTCRNTNRTIALSAGHGIVTGTVNVHWAGTDRDAVTGTIATNTLTVTGGSGDNLPDAETAVIVTQPGDICFEAVFDANSGAFDTTKYPSRSVDVGVAEAFHYTHVSITKGAGCTRGAINIARMPWFVGISSYVSGPTGDLANIGYALDANPSPFVRKPYLIAASMAGGTFTAAQVAGGQVAFARKAGFRSDSNTGRHTGIRSARDYVLVLDGFPNDIGQDIIRTPLQIWSGIDKATIYTSPPSIAAIVADLSTLVAHASRRNAIVLAMDSLPLYFPGYRETLSTGPGYYEYGTFYIGAAKRSLLNRAMAGMSNGHFVFVTCMRTPMFTGIGSPLERWAGDIIDENDARWDADWDQAEAGTLQLSSPWVDTYGVHPSTASSNLIAKRLADTWEGRIASPGVFPRWISVDGNSPVTGTDYIKRPIPSAGTSTGTGTGG